MIDKIVPLSEKIRESVEGIDIVDWSGVVEAVERLKKEVEQIDKTSIGGCLLSPMEKDIIISRIVEVFGV